MKNTFTTALLILALAPFSVQAVRKDDKEDNLYSSFGKRDPFKPPDRGGFGNGSTDLDPVRKYRLESYRLRAILRLNGKPQAMFEDPDGNSHVVGESDRIGSEGARISRIVNSEVIVTERTNNYLGKEILLEKVISLPVSEDNTPPVPGGPDAGGGLVQQSFSGGRLGASVAAPAAPQQTILSAGAAASPPPAAPAPDAGPAAAAPAAAPSYIQRRGP